MFTLSLFQRILQLIKTLTPLFFMSLKGMLQFQLRKLRSKRTLQMGLQ